MYPFQSLQGALALRRTDLRSLRWFRSLKHGSVRSPGIYYGIGHDKVGKELFTCTVIPNRGAWLEYETDSNDVFYVRVDRTRKVPVTVLIRALGYGTNAEILDLFGEEPKLLASFGKDTSLHNVKSTNSRLKCPAKSAIGEISANASFSPSSKNHW